MDLNPLCKGPATRGHVTKILRIMRITAFILLTCSLHLSARTSSQTISISAKTLTLKQAFNEIERQTGYYVVANKDLLSDVELRDIYVHHISLVNFLDVILKNQPLIYSIEDKNILVYLNPKIKDSNPRLNKTHFSEIYHSQPPITGMITDENGNPLEGVNIIIKGSLAGTVTDAKGMFSLNVKPGDILLITGIGFRSKEIKIGSESTLSIRLAIQSTVLDTASVEIINTGYQKLPKERATGSFDFIDNKKFNEQVSTNVLDRLEGIANSLNIDRRLVNTGVGKTGITIRGISTILGQKDPLIVVDNFPYDGDQSNLNPNNVESITVLKDAAAASIWGARAGNGVIVITTKQGKFGQRMKVTAGANVSITDKPDLFDIKQISSGDFIDFEKILFNGGYYDQYEQDIYGRPSLSPVVELLIKSRDNEITKDAADAQIELMKQYDVRKDFDRYVYKKGINHQYSLNVTGGANNIAYNLAAGYDRNADNLDAISQRINLTSFNIFKPLKNLEITAKADYTQTDNASGRTGYTNMSGNGYSQLPVYTRLADDNGNSLPVYKYRQTYIDTLGAGKLLDWKYYPLDDYKHTITNSNLIDITLNTSLSYQITSSFKVIFNYQYEKQKVNSTITNDLQSYLVRNDVNTFTQLPADGSAPVYPIPKGEIRDLGENALSTNQLRGQFNFDRSWGDHAINALGGGEIRSTVSDLNSDRLYGFDPNTYSNAPVDYVNAYPTIISTFYQQIPYSLNVSKSTNRFVSAFANAAYTYVGRYILSASMRKDGANIFGTTTNNKWKPLWSTGVAWNISKEKFYQISALPYLKLKATYGYSGNLGSSDLVGVTTIFYAYSANPYLGTPYSQFASYDNPDLRWESVGQMNIAADFATRSNTVSGSVEYFHKKTSDLYGPAAINYTNLPVAYITKNVGSTAGEGIDVQLLTRNIDRRIKWTTNWNMSWYKDRVISYYAGDTTASGLVGNYVSRPGNKAIHGIYSYQWAGLNPLTGDPQGYLNGHVSTDYYGIGRSSFTNAIYNGPASPTFFGAIDNKIEWNNLSLIVNIIYKAGYYFQRSSIDYLGMAGGGNGSADYAARWQKPGDELHTNVPSFVYPLSSDRDRFYRNSSVLIDKGDNIRLNYIKLNYAVNERKLKKIGMSALSFHLNAQNLGIIWKANKDGIDPDYQVNYQALKPSKVLIIGLTASF